jgi:hypothetical protein
MQEQPDDFESLQLTPENCLEELKKFAVHCREASSQLRELLNLPLLDSLEEQACEAKTLDQLSKSDAEIARISRVSFAANQGFHLDWEDLMQTIKMVSQSFDRADLNPLMNALSVLKPHQRELSALDELREPLRLYEELEKTASAALAILDSLA